MLNWIVKNIRNVQNTGTNRKLHHRMVGIWRMELTAEEHILADLKIYRDIFQGDSLSSDHCNL